MLGTLYLKIGLNGTYAEINVSVMKPFTTEVIEYAIVRKKWPEIEINNFPYEYKTLGGDKYRLYDILIEQDPTTEIYIKYIPVEGDTMEGYFGFINLVPNDDNSKLTVTPTIFDQYTYLLENSKEKVDIFGDANLLYNGDFGLWIEDTESILPDIWTPVGWVVVNGDYLSPTRDTLFGDSAAILQMYVTWTEARDEYYSYMSQIVNSIQKNRDIRLNFNYALIDILNPLSRLNNLRFKLSLHSVAETEIKYIDINGEWTDIETYVEYESSALPIPLDSLNKYKTYQLIIEKAPFSGYIKIEFFHDQVSSASEPNFVFPYRYKSDLAITNVELFSSDIEYTEVSIEFSDDNMVAKEQSLIERVGGYYYDYFIANPKSSIQHELEDYFESDGSPALNLLASQDHGPHGYGGIKYPELIERFQDEDDKFYKAALTEITIYKGPSYRKNIWDPWRRHIRGIATFTREEKYSNEVYTQEDEDLGLIPSGKSIGDFKPPEEGVGWFLTTELDTRGYVLWVRTPFNEEISDSVHGTWELSTKEVRTSYGRKYGFDWLEKMSSKRIYPVSDAGVTNDACVGLKGIFERIYRGTHSTLADKNVYSTFFFGDFPDDEYTAALLEAIPAMSDTNLNYYTLEDNILPNIVALHTYQLATTSSQTSKESTLLMSFDDIWADMLSLFPEICYFVDVDLNWHIEHKSYIDAINTDVDIRDLASDYNATKFDDSEMFALTEYEQVNSGYKDFNYSKITFDKIVSSKRAIDFRKQNTTKFITTDIQYCVENPDDISNGIILLNYETIDSVKTLRYDKGRISNIMVPNGYISIANLLHNFANFNGVWALGKINDIDRAFINTKWVKQGTKPIVLKGIYENNYFFTDIGCGFAKINKAIDYENRTTTITLIYSYNEFYIVVSDDEILSL